MNQFSVKSRAVALIVAATLITLLGLVSASWSNPALAQGTVKAQETPTPSPTPRVFEVGAPCDSPNLILLDILDQMIASAIVSPAPTKNICTLLQVVPEPNPGFPVTFPEFQIEADGLFGANSIAIASSPTGYTRITDAVQFAGAIGANNKVRMCFALPTNYLSFKALRIAYFDTTPTINRWVFLRTRFEPLPTTANPNPTPTMACMRNGLIKPIPPVVFALFGQN